MKNFFSLAISAMMLTTALTSVAQSSLQTIILQPGPESGIDAETRNDLPNQCRGHLYDFIANAWTAQGDFFIMRSFLKFDLSAIPEDATILYASLKLTTNLNTGHYQLDSGANTSYLVRISENWDESTITWNNQPEVNFSSPVVLPQSTSITQTYLIDVTDHITDMYANPSANFGWCLRLQTEEKYRCLVFASSDHPMAAWRPLLEVRFITCPAPLTDFTFQQNDFSVQFTNLSGPANAWYWNFGDGTVSVEENPMHTYAIPGSYLVTLETTDSCGTGIHSDTVTIACSAPTAGFTWELGDHSVAFTSTSTSPSVYAWHWDFGDSTTSNLQHPVHQFPAYGTYNVCLTVTDSCGTGDHCDMIYLLEPFALNTTINQSETDNLTVEFSDDSEWTEHWEWNFGDGSISTSRVCSHTYKRFGSYTVCLKAGNATEERTTCDTLLLKKVNVSKTGYGFVVYPNPMQSGEQVFFMTFGDERQVRIEITNGSGNVVYEKIFQDIKAREPFLLPVAGWPTGTYLLTCSMASGQTTIKLVIY